MIPKVEMPGRGPWAVAQLFVALAAGAGLLGCERASGPGAAQDNDGLTGGELVFQDDFERDELGPHWSSTSDVWRIERGVVQVRDARNAALWLDVELPERVRVELEVTAEHDNGDLKFELFGDGANHESGYILIYGGWENSTTCIARLDEHGSNRLDRAEHEPVVRGRTYRFSAVRTDQRLRWYIDDRLVLTYDDAAPLEGAGHRHLAFNNWAVPAFFDDVRIYDLSE